MTVQKALTKHLFLYLSEQPEPQRPFNSLMLIWASVNVFKTTLQRIWNPTRNCKQSLCGEPVLCITFWGLCGLNQLLVWLCFVGSH